MNLAYLRPLYQQPGPIASVYLATARNTAEAAKAISVRWRNARVELARDGADDATLNAIEEIVAPPDGGPPPTEEGNPPEPPGKAVFAVAGHVVYREDLAEEPSQHVRFHPLPDIMPLLEHRTEPVPHVQVKADRQGADIVAVGRQRHDHTVQGEDWPIQKVRAGGWSQARYQRSAEETWEHNAQEVADRVAFEAEAVGAEVILVGGDVRARELVLERLSEPYARRAVPAEHGARNAGASRAAWDAEVDTALREHSAQHRDAVVARFREAYGRGDGVAGLNPVTEALRDGRVETLLIAPPLRGELWYGPDPSMLGADGLKAGDLGIDDPPWDSAGAVLIRAAVAGDADLIFAEDLDLPDRIGALLRFAP